MPPRIPATTESDCAGWPMSPELLPSGRPVEVVGRLVEIGVKVVNTTEAEPPEPAKLAAPGVLLGKGTSVVDLGAIAVEKVGGSTGSEFAQLSDYETVERGGIHLSG